MIGPTAGDVLGFMAGRRTGPLTAGPISGMSHAKVFTSPLIPPPNLLSLRGKGFDSPHPPAKEGRDRRSR